MEAPLPPVELLRRGVEYARAGGLGDALNHLVAAGLDVRIRNFGGMRVDLYRGEEMVGSASSSSLLLSLLAAGRQAQRPR